jgi:hypothetical protein
MDDERVFIYVRLRLGPTVLARTKIREFGGLGTLLADFLRSIAAGVDLDGVPPPEPGVVPVMEYVDAGSDRALMSFRVDPKKQAQIVEGMIPAPYRRRMLDPKASSFSSSSFVERAAPDMTPERKEALAKFLVDSRFDLLAKIRESMDEAGRFEVELPLDGPAP